MQFLDEIRFWWMFGFLPNNMSDFDKRDFAPRVEKMINDMAEQQREASRVQLRLSPNAPVDLRELRMWRTEKRQASDAFRKADERLDQACQLAQKFGWQVEWPRVAMPAEVRAFRVKAA